MFLQIGWTDLPTLCCGVRFYWEPLLGRAVHCGAFTGRSGIYYSVISLASYNSYSVIVYKMSTTPGNVTVKIIISAGAMSNSATRVLRWCYCTRFRRLLRADRSFLGVGWCGNVLYFCRCRLLQTERKLVRRNCQGFPTPAHTVLYASLASGCSTIYGVIFH